MKPEWGLAGVSRVDYGLQLGEAEQQSRGIRNAGQRRVKLSNKLLKTLLLLCLFSLSSRLF